MGGDEVLMPRKSFAQHLKQHALEPRVQKEFRLFDESQKMLVLSGE